VTYVLGVDVGGTFTDVVLGTADGDVTVAKVMTTPADPGDAVVAGVGGVLARAGVGAGQVTRLVHGTTLATNVILERRGSDIAFVTTQGFADVLRLGREVRQEEERFDLFFRTPDPPVSRARTFEVRERVAATGEVLVPLEAADAAEVARAVAASKPAAVAICLLHSYANPEHERRLAEACRAALPAGTYVAASSEVWPEIREYERAITTALCASVGPVMSGYLSRLADRLAAVGITCPIEIMESSGGVMSAPLAARRPIYTIESGGAAGVIAAGFIGRLIGAPEVISFDMGGTTAKTGIVRHGRPDITHEFKLGGSRGSEGGRRGGGYPVRIPVVDLAEVGAGGGSVASVDEAGSLSVGPRSAGSVPGPACYGLGGTEPTVTDANLLLGYLRSGELSGGVRLDPELSRQAVGRHVAAPLGLDAIAAALAIHQVANAAMAAAIRVVTVQRGIDPAGFTLVGFGGAGPMHAAELADIFGIEEVVVPRAAGVASAVGLIASDLVVDRSVTRLMATASATPASLGAVFAELEAAARAELPDGGPAGTPSGAASEEAGGLVVSRSVDVRFRGQAHQLTVDADGGPDAIHAAFRTCYLETYGIDVDGASELVTFRVRVIRPVEKLTPVRHPDPPGGPTEAQPAGARPVLFADAAGFVSCPVFEWTALGTGSFVAGPAIIEGPDTTVVVPPPFSARVDSWSNLILRRSRPA